MRCNFYKYERKLQHTSNVTNMGGDVIPINMKGNYNVTVLWLLIHLDVISINMKGNYNR